MCSAGVHTVCGEGVEGYLIECAVSVRAGKYQVCGVRIFVQIQKAQNIGILETKTFECVLFKFYDQLIDLTPHMYIIYSILFLGFL